LHSRGYMLLAGLGQPSKQLHLKEGKSAPRASDSCLDRCDARSHETSEHARLEARSMT
jgi:hypothetical protein